MSNIKEIIESGKAFLGIEFGSTRIKAVLIDEEHNPIASGSHTWENRYENGLWTYSLDDIWTGLQDSYRDMAENVQKEYGVTIKKLGAIGFSAMMHGYMAFDKEGKLLAPFQTWRNSNTGKASEVLVDLFQYNIPLRWSIAHLYQCILDKEEHVKDIAFMTTLAGYIHWQMTGEKVLGVGDASGMFPIDMNTKDYDEEMIQKFDKLIEGENYPWKVKEIMPKVLVAGEAAGTLTEEGAKLLDPTGNLEAGIPLCPPEGDAGTGMVATNSVAQRTSNISAGTSFFSMVVLEKPLKDLHTEIDMVTTPDGSLVAMVHSNNGTTDLNAWVNLFKEFADSIGADVDMNQMYGTLYNKALEGDADCGGILSYGNYAGEPITNVEKGRPMVVRTPETKFTLANFMRSHLYTALGVIKVGMDILTKDEGVEIDLFDDRGIYRTIIHLSNPKREEWVKKSQFCHAGCMMKTEVLRKLKGYSESPKRMRVEDYDLWIRLYAAGYKGYNLQEALYDMRDDRNALHRRTWKNRVNEVRVKYSACKSLKLDKKCYLWTVIPIIKWMTPSVLYKTIHKKGTRK